VKEENFGSRFTFKLEKAVERISEQRYMEEKVGHYLCKWLSPSKIS